MQTHTLDALGATITYDIRGDLADATPDRPVLMMVASPMDASRLHHPGQLLHSTGRW